MILRIGEPGRLVGAFVIIDRERFRVAGSYCQVTTRPSFSPDRSRRRPVASLR